MSNVRLELRLDQIVVPDDRLRAADPIEVDKVAASMAEVGQLQDIEVRSENAEGKFPLNIGLHRMLAAQKIGKPTLWAHVFDGSDDEARLREIDENLHRHELNALDQAVFLAARREVYERLHGKIVAGRPKKKIGVHARQFSFFDDTFDRFGLSRDVVKRALTRFTRQFLHHQAHGAGLDPIGSRQGSLWLPRKTAGWDDEFLAGLITG